MHTGTRITKRVITQLRPPEAGEKFVWDSELRGFGIRIKASGAGAFVVQYRNTEGRTRRYKIGSISALDVDEARKAAKRLLADVAHGADPALERRTFRQSLTVDQLCERYVADAEKGLVLGRRGSAKKSTTLVTDKGRIERHIKPLLGSRKVVSLTSADIVEFMRNVQIGKTAGEFKTKPRGKAVVRGGRGTASRTMGLLGGILSYAQRQGVRADNPARGIQRPADAQRQRFLAAEEYAALRRAMRSVWGDRANLANILILLALTGARKNEIVRLRWDEVDLQARVLHLGDTKTGLSIRPLCRQALAILGALSRSSEWVFPALGGKRPITVFEKAWPCVFEQAGLAGCTPHTLRHSFATHAASLGYSEFVVAGLLGHRLGSVTSRYVKRVDDVLLSAADRVGDHIHGSLAGLLPFQNKELSAANDNAAAVTPISVVGPAFQDAVKAGRE